MTSQYKYGERRHGVRYTLNVFDKCDDHVPFLDLFDVTLKNLGVLNVTSFSPQHSFFAHFFLSDCRIFQVEK